MALTDENGGGIGATMLVGPTGIGGNYGGYPVAYPVMGGYGGGGLGGFGGDWSALIILFLFAAMFGGFGGGFGMGGFGGGFGNMFEFPWLLNGQQQISNNTNNGFRDQMIQDNITSVRDGISGLSTQLCGCCGDIQMGMANGFANTAAAITGAQNALAQQMYANQIAELERSFAAQTASTHGMTALQAQLAQCCCDNRLATNDVKYTIASEECATRANSTQNTQGILNAINGGIQSIKDQLCQDKIDAKNDEIAQLRQEILYARGQASQVAQNSAIINGVYNRLNECPVGTVPVYGEQPIFTCPNNRNSGCGCGCGNNF